MCDHIELENAYGYIYITTNNTNGMKYIGQACYHRKQPRNYLGSGTYLTRAIKKYGRSNFSKEIIDAAENPEGLNEKEKYWIAFYDATNNPSFYNLAEGGDGGNTISGYSDKQREEYKKKLSEIRKGKVNVGAKNGCAKPVICLNTMEVFECGADAARKYSICPETIYSCCSHKTRSKTAGVNPDDGARLQWEYYEQGKDYKYVPYHRDYKELSKPVKCITTGEVFDTTDSAAKTLHVALSAIKNCCTGKTADSGLNRKTGLRLQWEFI